MVRDKKEEYSKEESERRLRSAILGARAVGHKPMESMTQKKVGAQRKRRSKNAASATAKTS
jgi:hypothetical protein